MADRKKITRKINWVALGKQVKREGVRILHGYIGYSATEISTYFQIIPKKGTYWNVDEIYVVYHNVIFKAIRFGKVVFPRGTT